MWCRNALARTTKSMRSPLRSIVERVQRAHRRLRLALGGAERGEVVLADEQRGRLAHRSHVERQVEPADVARRERGAHRRG